MTVDVLNDYIDAVEMVKETRKELERLEKEKKDVLQDSVMGSNHEYPYEPKKYVITGNPDIYSNDASIRFEEKILKERIEKAEEIKTSVQQYLNTIPMRMQRIIKYKFFENLTWEQVAIKMGRNATAESVKKEFQRFQDSNTSRP